MDNLLYNIKTLFNKNALNYQSFFTRFYGAEQEKFVNLYKTILAETHSLTEPNEAYNIFACTVSSNKIKGDIAEVGTYKGASSKVICDTVSRLPSKKNIYLFDTFEGLPRINKKIDRGFTAGEYTASYDEVKKYLSKYRRVKIVKGIFPKSGNLIKKKRFSFVHLDVDIYQSTLDCLNFFYPRMTRGGIILSHDYSNSPGVKRAVNNFFMFKPDLVLTLQGTQCLIVKI